MSIETLQGILIEVNKAFIWFTSNSFLDVSQKKEPLTVLGKIKIIQLHTMHLANFVQLYMLHAKYN